MKNRDEPGCHNLWRARKAFRAGQIGYAYCQVFSRANCRPETALTASWAGGVTINRDKREPTDRLSRGNKWMLSPDRSNVEVRSWLCVAEE